MDEQPLRAIVTGGGGGIGREICAELAGRGAHVAVWDLTADLANAAASTLGNAEAFVVDVTDSASVDRATGATVAAFGGIDLLVNNAGVSLVGDQTHELSDEIWHTSIGVMQTGVFFCSRSVGRVMIEQGQGGIVNISSIRGFSSNPGRLAYCAAKAAVLMMTRVMAAEWGPYGIRVNAIAPGVQATGMWKNGVASGIYDEERYLDVIPARRIGDPRDIGKLCWFLSSSEAAYVNGACLTIDGGLSTIPAG